MFLICYFLVINIYCFFDDHDTRLLLLEYFLLFVQVSAVFESLLNVILQFPSHLEENFQKKTHTRHCFSLKNHRQSFSLNHLFLQFNPRRNSGFYFCGQSLSEEIRRILLCKTEVKLFTSHQLLVTFYQLLVTSYVLLVAALTLTLNLP